MSKRIKHQPHSSKNEEDVSVVVEMMHYWPQRPQFEAAVLRLEMMEKHTKQLLLCKKMMLQDYYNRKFSTPNDNSRTKNEIKNFKNKC
jgi:hypothetical protein